MSHTDRRTRTCTRTWLCIFLYCLDSWRSSLEETEGLQLVEYEPVICKAWNQLFVKNGHVKRGHPLNGPFSVELLATCEFDFVRVDPYEDRMVKASCATPCWSSLQGRDCGAVLNPLCYVDFHSKSFGPSDRTTGPRGFPRGPNEGAHR